MNFGFLVYLLHVFLFDVSNNIWYVDVENGALLRDIGQSWKMSLEGRGKSWKSRGKFFWEKGGNQVVVC